MLLRGVGVASDRIKRQHRQNLLLRLLLVLGFRVILRTHSPRFTKRHASHRGHFPLERSKMKCPACYLMIGLEANFRAEFRHRSTPIHATGGDFSRYRRVIRGLPGHER